MPRRRIQLKPLEVITLSEMLVLKESLPCKTLQRCKCLLLLSSGKMLTEVQVMLGVSYTTIRLWKALYKKEGINFLFDKHRSGRPFKSTSEVSPYHKNNIAISSIKRKKAV